MKNYRKLLQFAVLTLTFSLLLSCASTPKVDPRIVNLENQFNDLISNNELASFGGEELARAQKSLNYVKNQHSKMDKDDLSYSIYATGRLIELAKYSAQSRWFDSRREELVNEQSKLVLESRTLEADLAQQRANEANASAAAAEAMKLAALEEANAANASAAEAEALKLAALEEANAAKLLRDEALEQKQLAVSAKAEAELLKAEAEAAANSAMSEAEKAKIFAAAETAKAEAAIAEANAAKAAMQQLENELSELKAKQTERGLVITLGDVLFEFNKAELKEGAARNLAPLVKALTTDIEQTVIVEGHTDNIGSKDYNVSLSEKRAESVKAYLVGQGIDGARISTDGLGFDYPVASNDTNEGRQQNRRVEIILPQE
jgi:outer membrane protein OmpA-like peptidoglycan-associated protein